MKKIITLLAVAFAANLSIGQTTVFQSDLSSWDTSGNPTDFFGPVTSISSSNVTQVSTGATYGTSFANVVNTSTSHKRLTTQPFNAIPSTDYVIKMFIAGTAEVRVRAYDVTNSSYVSNYTNYQNTTGTAVTMYTDTVTTPSGCNSMSYIISLRNTAALGIALDSVSITALTSTPPPPATYLSKTIYDIQYTTDASGDSPYKDSLVETSGIVTGMEGSKFFLQDGTGAWNGVYVYNFVSSPSIAVGDNITIKGEVAEYYGLTQVKNIDTIIVNSTGNTLPAAIMLNSSTMQDEQYEGCLVKLTGATCVNPSAGFGEWDVLNATDTGVIDDLMYAYTPTLGTNYDVTGIMYYSFGEYKLEPRDTTDISLTSSTSLNEKSNDLTLSLFPNPVSDFFTIEGVNLGTAEIMNAEGKIIKSISLNYINTIDVSELTNGIYIIKVTSDNKVGFTRFVKQ